MLKNVLSSIAGIEVFPVISLLVFVAVFCVVIVWFFRADKQRMNSISRIPLDDDEAANTPPVSAAINTYQIQ